ncbi:DNA-binding transcriptional regulator, LysR family [Aeromonas sp. RU39B]|uniref:LysR family transcriptional regulator n=1 Tax=Aeromonas sp. RU39B TaxID=1907416 RepID=UPI00095700D5|nr:LysR family transcriptional regulator [Aeromonas sp. RU39B]SIQ42671.1 DNA-binding transcriptional regulator, LysR family [Aeromonas sp. RU39B]
MGRLQSMEVFAKAVEQGSFSAAGEALRISSQMVGKHIQSLEKHLGIRLLNRTTRRQHLTEAGMIFYERVKIILAEVEAAEGMVSISEGTPRGRLRISAPVSFGIHALTKHLPDYMQQYPEVSVDMSLSNGFVDLIDDGFDVAFRVGELADSGLIARTLAPYRLILCAAPSYLASHALLSHPNELTNHECLGFSYTELRTRWTFSGADGDITVPVSGKLMVDSGEALLMAARAGLGVLLQPAELVRDDLDAGRLVELLPEFRAHERPFHLFYAPDRCMSPKLRSFIDFALARFGADNARNS